MTSTMRHYIPDMAPSSSNTTFSSLFTSIVPLEPGYPKYHTSSRSFFTFISDKNMVLLVPVLAYWLYSLFFHFLDTMEFSYFEKRRLHESPEVMARNKATVTEVVKAVIFQHAVQVVLGLLWFGDEESIYREQVRVDHLGKMASLAPKIAKGIVLALGPRSGEQVLRNHGQDIVRWAYWWGIPAAQFFFAFFILDTWQYFLHRLFHTSRFLYRHVHSIHHRLYCPYAFGALYNHPLEGFLFDSLGATLAHELSFMTTRQAALFFGISSLKTVDDHCGYRLWWDPCQLFFSNNADYHDIHHQAYGIKANFSQPYFTNWDVLLGTRMTREEAELKTRRSSKLSGVPITRIDKTE